jgi:hypothetical protein
MSESETGSTLLAMLLDDYYQQNFQPPIVAEEPDIPFPQDERGQAEGDRKRSGRKRSGSSRRGGGRKKDN